jgi:hypothetical protein
MSVDLSSYGITRIDKDLKRLEALLLEGLDSGAPIEATHEFWQDLRARIEARRNAHLPAS